MPSPRDDGRNAPATQGDAFGAAWDEASAAWPSIDLPKDVFVAHLSALVPEAARATGTLGDLHVADLYLACACARGNAAAIRALEQVHLSHVPRFLAKTSSDRAFTDEVVQALRSKLLLHDGGPPKILEYAGRGSLGAWLRVTAIRTAQTMLRRRGPKVRTVEPDAVADVLGASVDAEMKVLRAKLGPRVIEAFRASMQGLSAEQRNLLRLHYFDGLSFERMGALFGVNRATACRWVAEARRMIIEGTRRRLKDELGLRDSEIDALTRLLRSQLDVSMSGLLAGG